jgi:ABC-type uncharacterized transport system permease subunit
MSEFSSAVFWTALISGAILAGMPLLLGGLGETIAERAGLLTIGLEGYMLFGGYVGFVVALYSHSSAAGLIAGLVAGMVGSLIMMFLCVRWGLDQIVVGIGILFLFEGMTSVAQRAQFGTTYPRLGNVPVVKIPLLDRIPAVGASLFSQPLVVYLSFLLVVVIWWVLKYTNAGLSLRAAGEKPKALDVSGVSVLKVRSIAALITGALGGLAGAYMAIIGAGIFVPFMTKGAGFISIVVAMLGRGKPGLVVVGAFIFGLTVSVGTALQIVGVSISTDFINMLPFLIVMAALILLARRSVLPAALAIPYKREGH